MPGGKKKTVKPSKSMIQRMEHLESKLGAVLVGRANHGKLAKAIHGKQLARKSGTGRLGLGARPSGSVNRKSLPLEEDEYICEINGSSAFATTAFPINPGQVTTFPWGYRLSQLYEEYDFEMLEFYYKREVSEFATQGDSGKIILSIDYDAMDPPPTSKQQVEDTQPHMDGMPCTPEIRLRADCALMRKNPGKYVRVGSQVANTDLRVYDAGTLYVSTQGCTNTNVIGELRVRYKVKLKVQVLNPALGAQSVYHSSAATCAAGNLAFSGMVAQPGSNLSISLGNSGGNSFFSLPQGAPGTYVAVFQAEQPQYTFPGTISFTYSGGSTATSLWSYGGARDATSYIITSPPGSASDSYCAMVAFTNNGSAGSVFITGFTTTYTCSTDLWVFQLPPSLVTLPAPSRSNIYDTMARRITQLEAMLPAAEPKCDARDGLLLAPPPLVRNSSSSSSGLNDVQVAAMYAKLTALGVIPEDDSPVAVAGADGIVRISQADAIRPMGISTSAPPPSAGLRKLLGLP